MLPKRCCMCSTNAGKDVFHDLSAFGFNSRTDDGFAPSCKASRNVYLKEWEAKKKAERKMAMMTTPPRPDRVFKGKPGKPIKRVSTNRSDWSW